MPEARDRPHSAADDARLGRFTAHIAAIEQAQWTALLIDPEWRLRWVSSELQHFIGETDVAALGYGLHLSQAWTLPAWLRTIDPESLAKVVRDVGPFLLGDLAEQGVAAEDVVPAESRALLAGLEAAPPPPAWCTLFRYVDPDGVEELGGYTVQALFMRLRARSGDVGWVALFDIAVPPHLVALLARGDLDMYGRMARLVQPGRRAAAILFCDLHGSGTLSRTLPTAEYFGLIRRLWTAIDAAVAASCGIVGKHAGDGATAFFLADDVGGESEAARAAVLTARRVHELSSATFRDVAGMGCLMKVGIHWGSGLYMGQLVPGGRLDVTALGDEVNEAARIQEAAQPHETLASKQLIERLSEADAADLGLDQHAITYRLLGELAPQHDKVVRDAGTLAVTRV